MNRGNYLILIIDSNSQSDERPPSYLHKINDVPLIHIMASRLKKIDIPAKVLLLIDLGNSSTIKTIQECGWIPIIKNKFNWNYFNILRTLQKSPNIIVADPQYPFIDKDTWLKTIKKFEAGSLSLIKTENFRGFAPIAIVQKYTFLYGIIRKKILKKKQNFIEYIQGIIPKRKYQPISFDLPIISDCLRADTVSEAIIDSIGGLNFSLQSLLDLEANKKMDSQYVISTAQNYLYQQMLNSNTPHKLNRRLSEFEAKYAIPIVKSFPSDIALTITGKCNANCLFCNYNPSSKNNNDRFSLEDIKKMTWLRYTRKLGLGGGLGEPLLHPEFKQIFNYLNQEYPHLKIRIITNGTLLNKKLCRDLAGNLSKIRISLNAATATTWETLMRTRGFEKVCAAVSSLSAIKKEMRTNKPEIILMMVVSRHNITEAVQFAELAYTLGAQAVDYSHFRKNLMIHCNMGLEDSLYLDKQHSDIWLDKAKERADKLGLRVYSPLPFYDKEKGIFIGERLIEIPEKCYSPWYTAYFTRTRNSDSTSHPLLGFCCSGVDSKITYSPYRLDEQTIIRLWNHPYLQHFRRTVNTKKSNPVCNYCRTIDQSDPGSFAKSMQIIQNIKQHL